VDRKKNLIVITVPKQTASAPVVASAPAATPAGSAATTTNNASAWEDSIFSDFNRIQDQMDQV
jgi:HSP20 family molecular chaperone IbpA